jgi:DNA adenine methylase
LKNSKKSTKSGRLRIAKSILPNVKKASFQFLSPFRYPGGKSWFLPNARKWLKNRQYRPRLLVEPFGGGASVSLLAVYEGLVLRAEFAERDPDVAATWQSVLNGDFKGLVKRIRSFKVTRKNVIAVINGRPTALRNRAFRCIVQNRTARGGVIAKGAGLIREGEDGNGLRSRWYAETLAERIATINSLKRRLKFVQTNGQKLIEKYLHRRSVVFFVDPPYTQAASRLYRHWKINHGKLFELLSKAKGDVLMTYDDTPEIRRLAKKYKFKVRRIPMRTTHHQHKHELMISRSFAWQKRSRAR